MRLKNGTTVVLEIKGMETEQNRVKLESAARWVTAVNNARTLARWAFHVCKDPQELGVELAEMQGTGADLQKEPPSIRQKSER